MSLRFLLQRTGNENYGPTQLKNNGPDVSMKMFCLPHLEQLMVSLMSTSSTKILSSPRKSTGS